MATYVHHVGLIVSDVERSVEFYKKVGFEPGDPTFLEYGRPWLGEMTRLDGARAKFGLMALGGFALELMEFVAPAGLAQGHDLKFGDVGLGHFCLHVDDIDAEYERLAAQGIEFRGAPATCDEPEFDGTQGAYFYDPDGHVIELVHASREYA